MSFLSKIPHEIQSIIFAGSKEMVGYLWHHITGEHDDEKASDIAKHVAEHVAQVALQEAQNKLGAEVLAQELERLKKVAAHMQPWADDMLAKIRKMNEEDRAKLFVPMPEAKPEPKPDPKPLLDFDSSDTITDGDVDK